MVEPQDPLRLAWAILSSFPNIMSARKTLKIVSPMEIIGLFGAIEYTQSSDYPTYRATHFAHSYFKVNTLIKPITEAVIFIP